MYQITEQKCVMLRMYNINEYTVEHSISNNNSSILL